MATDPDWLQTITARTASVPNDSSGWCCPACRDSYIKQVSEADLPLVRDMLRLVVNALEMSVLNLGVHGEKALSAEQALAAYRSGVLPEEGS